LLGLGHAYSTVFEKIRTRRELDSCGIWHRACSNRWSRVLASACFYLLMSLTIRKASLESDRPGIVAFLRRFLTPEFDVARFDWLYTRGPHGQAQAWLACDREQDIVGVSAVFPRRFSVRGGTAVGWVLGDFCLADRYRALGPALQLQRATLESARVEADFCYDFPSDAMMAVYSRLCIGKSGSLIRWAKPLRVEPKLERALGSKKLAAFAAKPGNAVLRARGWKGPESSCDVELFMGPCGEEFSELGRSIAAESIAGVRIEKSASYVNWRFLDRGASNVRILVARKSGRLVGYVVFRSEKKDARILDLVSPNNPGVIARLLHSAVNELALLGASSVSLTAGNHHPWAGCFRQSGFRPREASPIVLIVRPGSAVSSSDLENDWFLMEGERDS
jgi:hypothetical protein